MQMKLYVLRKNKYKKTQQEIADYLEISVVSYRNKEKGKNEFTQDEMFALAKLFNCSIDYIFLPREHQNGDNSQWNYEE